ncbi:hypothetical protein IJG04_02455 [Candidatus Saccharibacteria bacterium]|nr:hypothetical protein [Candidatus Saccharibacteria bacterium]
MEPNQVNAQNTNGNAGATESAVTPTTQPAPADSIVTMSDDSAIQSAPVAQTSPAKPKSYAMLLGMILLAVVAVGGIVFGAVTMAQKGSEAEQYQKQIAMLRETINEQAEDTESITVATPEGEEVEVGGGSIQNASDYVYASGWDLKVAIPEEMEAVSYAFDWKMGYTVLKVAGTTKDGQSLPDFASIDNCVLGAVDRYSKTNVEAGLVPSWYPEPFMSDGEYNYYYNGPQAVCTEGDAQLEVKTVEVIKNMLSNPDNYSTI